MSLRGKIAAAVRDAATRRTDDYKNAVAELDEYLGIQSKKNKKTSAGFGYPHRTGGSTASITYDGSKMRGTLRSLYSSGKELDHNALRARSREAYWDSMQGGALLQRLVDNVIGNGLTLEHTPLWELTGTKDWDAKKRRAFCRDVELKWYAWASSHEPDATGRRSLPELQGFAFMNELRDGEAPTVLRYDGDAERVNPLCLQFIDPEQIDDLYDATFIAAAKARGNEIRDGMEITSSGKIVAVYVTSEPGAKPVRVEVKQGKRRFLILPAILDLPGQIRGTGVLAPVLHELQKITDYELFELEAALVNAIVAAYVKPSADADTKTDPRAILGGGISARGSTTPSASTDVKAEDVHVRQPGLFVASLKKGEDIASFDTKRPNVNFGVFVDAIMKSISARMSEPIEVVEEKFSSNYSASRAALILFWQVVERWRVHFASQWLQPIFEAWFVEMVDRKLIEAPGFGSTPLITRAWLATTWIGQSMPSIDPVKDAEAADIRIAQGATCRERNAQNYDGSDYYDNMEKQAAEREVMPKVEPVDTLTSPGQPTKGTTEDEGKTDSETEEDTDFEGLKQEMDSYGVAVRAGAITPQPEDEDHFRAKGGFPPASQAVKSAWEKDEGVRRPITLTQSPGSAAQTVGQKNEEDPDTEKPEEGAA